MAVKKQASQVITSIIGNDALQFDGVARSVECYDNQGFRNFRMLTLTLEKGVVTKIERSDPHATFELLARLELKEYEAVLNLNAQWENGKALLK